LKYPDDIRRHIYTTNAVESLHSKIELTRYCSSLIRNSMPRHKILDKSPVKKITLELIYDVITGRTQELKEEIKQVREM